MGSEKQPAVLLVHGAWHGSWCWTPVRELLESAGREVRTVENPTANAPDSGSQGVADDVAVVSQAIDAIDGEVIVVAHSYGGIPATIAAVSPKVSHILYIAAFALDESESLLGAVGGEYPDWWDVQGQLVVAGTPEHRPVDLFYADVEQSLADSSTAKLSPQSLRSFTDPVTTVAWRDRPTSYLVTEQDAVVPVFAQDAMAERSESTIHRLPTSHSPFLSQPQAVADIIGGIG